MRSLKAFVVGLLCVAALAYGGLHTYQGVTPVSIISGTVSISNLPALQAVGKSMTLLGANAGSISGSVATGSHKIQRIIGDNASGTTLYLMTFDSTTLPSNGSTPNSQCMVPFGISSSPSENVRNFGEDYVTTTTGVYVVWSTTSGTLTAVSSGTGLGWEVYGG